MATPCITRAVNESGLTSQEAGAIVNEAQAYLRSLKQSNQPIDTAMRAWLEAKQQDLAMRKAIQRRQAAYNALRRRDMASKIATEFDGDYASGIEAMLWGVGGKEHSAASVQASLMASWRGALDTDLQRLGPDAKDLFLSGLLDKDIAMAVTNLGRNLPVDQLDGNAVDIARVLRKHNDAMREYLNRQGAFVGYTEDFIFSQIHDQRKIAKTSFDEWWSTIYDKLDWQRTFGWDRNLAESSAHFMDLSRQIAEQWHYRLKTGNHVKPDGLDFTGKTAGTGGGNVAARASKERQIHFKDGAAFFEYQQKFGIKRLSDGIAMSQTKAAKTAGILQVLGPNWEANIDSMVKVFSERSQVEGKAAQSERLASNSFRRTIDNAKAALDGRNNIPVNPGLHTVASGFRVSQYVSKLGAAVLSAVSDPANAAASASAMYGRYSGKRGYFAGLGAVARGIMASAASRKDMARIASKIGTSLNVLRGTMLNEFGNVDGAPGFMTALQNAHSKLSLLGPMTNAMRMSTAVFHAQSLADMLDAPFSKLVDNERRALADADIGEPEWRMLRHTIEEDTVGDDVVRIASPDRVDAIPDAEIADYLSGKWGQNPTATMIALARDDLKAKMMTHYGNTVDGAILEIRARQSGQMRQGAKAGTIIGEAWLSVLQFKSFPFAYLSQRLAKDFRYRGINSWRDVLPQPGESWKDALMRSGAWLPHLVFNTFMLTGFGYLGMTLKDLAKGRTPRDPDAPNTWKAAFMQGGGAGIYGDFLFGEMKNRYGQGPLQTFLGPTASTISDAMNLFGLTKGGEVDRLGPAMLRFGYNNAPFANLFYTRLAFDYFFMWRAMEEMNPGYQQRMKRAVKENMGQDMLIEMPGGF